MLVYTPSITPRIEYIFNLLLKEMIGINYRFTQNVELFNTTSSPKLAYANSRVGDGLYIQADQLLFENVVRKVPLEIFSYQNLPAFFQGDGQLPFDIFAASFYLVTRYEEYLPSPKDKFGRFQARHSLAFKQQFLDKPLVNLWVEVFKKLITDTYPSMLVREPQFSGTMGFDIDVAYAVKGRTMTRNILIACRQLLYFRFQDFLTSLKIHAGKTADPYNSYDYILHSLSATGVKHHFFFLLARRLTAYDRNISPFSNALTSLVKRLQAFSEIGLHPSYYSSDDKAIIAQEKQALEALSGRPVTISRQHYLRFQLPETFMHLIEAGISDDYSMAYAELPGFRASICSPFHFYNLVEEKETTLTIHPVSYMEGTFIEDLHMQPDESISIIKQLVETVKSVKGAFICIWHNHTLSDQKIYKGWRKPYEATLRLLKETE